MSRDDNEDADERTVPSMMLLQLLLSSLKDEQEDCPRRAKTSFAEKSFVDVFVFADVVGPCCFELDIQKALWQRTKSREINPIPLNLSFNA